MSTNDLVRIALTVWCFVIAINVPQEYALAATAAQAPGDVEQRGLLQRIRETEESLGLKNWLQAAERFDAAWEMATENEDPLLVNTGADVKQLAAGETESLAGGTARLEDLFEKSSAEFRAEFQRQFSELAEQRVQEAIRGGDRNQLKRVSVRYVFCPAAQQGIQTLARLAADRGDFLEAALLLGRISRLGTQRNLAIELQAAACYSRAGLTADASDLIRGLMTEPDAATLKLNGSVIRFPESPADLDLWLSRNMGASGLSEFQWMQPGGSYRRFARQARSPARIVPMWKSDLFQVNDVLFADEMNPVLQDFVRPIEQAATRLLQMNSTIIPVAAPLLVGDLAIIRMPWGIRAVKVTTGELVWEVIHPDSRLKVVMDYMTEQSRKRQAGVDPADNSRFRFGQMVDPRGQLLYQLVRTNTASQMSVSGRTLFVCEESSGATWDEINFGLVNAETLPSNYIRAYDVETGIFLWEVGGQANNAVLQGGRGNRLSGYYFLGAPLVLGRRTYVLAEGGEGLFLIQIAAPDTEAPLANPEIVQSQLLTVPRYRLASHPVRKHAGLIPSFAQGLLICPTCDERIVAVSGEDHSIRWIFRYAGNMRTQEFGGEDPVLFGGRDAMDTKRVDLDSRWIDSLPRIADGRILVTPRDSDQIYCLDLKSGVELWNAPRGPFHAIAAVTSDYVVLAGNQTVAALNLADGKPVWTTEIREGIVCGTAASDGTVLHVPTTEPAIVTLEIATGHRRMTQGLSGSIPPGNLLISEKGVLSQNLTSVMFAAQGSSEKAVVELATELLLKGETANAVELLETRINAVTEASLERDLLIQVLLESLRNDFQKHRHSVPRVRELIMLSQRDVQIEPLLHTLLGMNLPDAAVVAGQLRGRSDRWLGELTELVARGLPGSQSSPLDDVEVSIRELLSELPGAHTEAITSGFLARSKASMLIAGIRDAVSKRPAAEQAELQTRLKGFSEGVIQQLPPGNANTQFIRDLNACGMSELALDILAGLNETTAPFGRGLLAELLGLQVAQSAAPNHSAAAITLVENWLASGDRTSIDAWLGDLSGAVDAGTVLRFQMTDGAAQESLLALVKERHPELAVPANSVWAAETPTMTESDDRTMLSTGRLPDDIPNTSIPLFGAPGIFRGWSFVRLLDRDDVGAFDPDGVLQWTFRPLGVVDDSGLGTDQDSYATASGHLLMLNLSGTLFALDTLNLDADKHPRLLWQKTIERLSPDAEANLYREYDPSAERLDQYQAQHSGFYPVGPVSLFGLPVISGRRLTVLDAITGEEQWQVDGIARDAVLLCSGERVLLISETSRQTEVRSLIDGTILSTSRLPEWWGEANGNVGSSVRDVDIEEGVDLLWRIMFFDHSCLLFRLSSGKSMLECRDLLTDSVTWSMELPEDSVFSNVAEDVVAVISEGKQLKLVQVDTGKLLVDLSVTPIAEPRELLLRSSHGHYIVLPEAVEDPSIDLDPVINSMHVNGRIWAIRKETLTLAWEHPVEHRWLRMMSPERQTLLPNAPILTLVSRGRSTPPGSSTRGTRHGALVLDVRTGKELMNSDDVGVTLNNHWLRMDPAAKKIELSFEKRVVTFDYSPQ